MKALRLQVHRVHQSPRRRCQLRGGRLERAGLHWLNRRKHQGVAERGKREGHAALSCVDAFGVGVRHHSIGRILVRCGGVVWILWWAGQLLVIGGRDVISQWGAQGPQAGGSVPRNRRWSRGHGLSKQDHICVEEGWLFSKRDTLQPIGGREYPN